jgi:hypothetical protein
VSAWRGGRHDRRTDYVVGDARKNLNAVLAAEKKNNFLPAGTDRLWSTKVTPIAVHRATITTCDDGTKSVEENPNTGELLPAPPLDQQFLFETWNFVPAAWALGHHLVHAGVHSRSPRGSLRARRVIARSQAACSTWPP